MTDIMRLERAYEIVKGIIARESAKEEWVSLMQVKSDVKHVLGELKEETRG
tara:strand:+ start:204 stop:356 length:153 start_codon:yes stop_codon:yes gene_type:complete